MLLIGSDTAGPLLGSVLRTRDGVRFRSLASALALVMISLSVGACGPDASESSTTRSSDQGFESARSVLLEFFVGLGSDKPALRI